MATTKLDEKTEVNIWVIENLNDHIIDLEQAIFEFEHTLPGLADELLCLIHDIKEIPND